MPEEDPVLQPQSRLAPSLWDLEIGASGDAPSFPRRTHEPAAPTADTAGMGPSHRACGRKI